MARVLFMVCEKLATSLENYRNAAMSTNTSKVTGDGESFHADWI